MRTNVTLLLTGIGWALAAASSSGDTTVSFRNSQAGEAGDVQTVSITDGRVRMEAGAGDDTFLLYHQSVDTFFAVRPSQKSYMELDPESTSEMLDQASQMRQQMMQQLKERLAEMPEDQREQMLEMMNRAGAPMQGAPQEEVTYRDGSGTATVSGLRCRWVEAYQGGRKVRELCLVEPDALGMTAADTATMMAMQKSMKAMADRIGGEGMFIDDMPDGFPIHVRHLDDDGEVTAEQMLEAVSQNDVDPERFEVPADYTRQEIPKIGMN